MVAIRRKLGNRTRSDIVPRDDMGAQKSSRSVASPHADPAAPVQQQPQPMHAPSPALVAAAAAAAAGSPQMRGAGRGMANVLPAWMTAQQQQQQAGFAPPVAGQFDNAWGGNGAAGAGGAHASPTQNGAPPRSDLRYS